MQKIKNPSNKNSIPSIIISDYDENQIKDINKKSLRHTVTIANTIVLIVAFIIIGIS